MSAWLEVGLSNALVATGLALLAYGVTRVVRRPEIALVVWLLVLVKLLMPPLVSVPWEGVPLAQLGFSIDRMGEPRADSILKAPDAMALAESELAASAEPIVLHAWNPSEAAGPSPDAIDRGRRWITAGFLTWAVGSVLWFALAAVRMVRFRRTLRHAAPAGSELRVEVEDLANRLDLRRVPAVRLVNRRIPPLVWAMTGQATMLLPAELMRNLTADQRATLLAHELAHLKRRDYLVRWVELAALGLYWWHPVAWWARRNIEQAEEHCCDAHVVALLPELARAYAEALMATVDFLAETPAVIPLGAHGFYQLRLLKRRMEMILSGTVSRRVNWPLRLALLMLGLFVLPLSIRGAAAQAEESSPKKVTVTLHTDDAKPASSVDERLERLEKTMHKLAKQLQETQAMLRRGAQREETTKRDGEHVADEARVEDDEQHRKQPVTMEVRTTDGPEGQRIVARLRERQKEVQELEAQLKEVRRREPPKIEALSITAQDRDGERKAIRQLEAERKEEAVRRFDALREKHRQEKRDQESHDRGDSRREEADDQVRDSDGSPSGDAKDRVEDRDEADELYDSANDVN